MTTDLDGLALRAARGDGDAFAFVCRALNDEVWRYCRALTGDADLASDAAQETFVRLVAAIRSYRGKGPIRAYVLTIARRSVTAVAKERRRHAVADAGGEPVSADHAHHTEALLLVADLPIALRDAFVLTQLLGLRYDEAAQVCDCPMGTIRSRVYRAREQLVAAMSDPDWIAPPTAEEHPDA